MGIVNPVLPGAINVYRSNSPKLCFGFFSRPFRCVGSPEGGTLLQSPPGDFGGASLNNPKKIGGAHLNNRENSRSAPFLPSSLLFFVIASLRFTQGIASGCLLSTYCSGHRIQQVLTRLRFKAERFYFSLKIK
jgi:hypothetical protein